MESFLTALSQRVGLNLDYFFRQGFWVSTRYGIVSACGVITTIAFARLADKELLGQYQTILSFLGLISIFSLPGLNMMALRAVTEGRYGIIQQAVWISFRSSLLAWPIIFGYAAYQYIHQDAVSFALGLVAAGIAFPFFYAPNTWYVAYEGKSQFRPVALRAITLNILLCSLLFLGLWLQADLVWLVLIYFGVNILFAWYFYWEIIRGDTEPHAGLNLSDIRYARSVSWQKFAYGLSENLPVLATAFFFGYHAAAIFQIAVVFLGAFSGFLSGLSATYLPLLFKYQRLHYGRIFLQHLIIGIVLYGILLLLLHTIFIRFYGPAYAESLRLALALSPLVILYPLRVFLLNFLTAENRNRIVIQTLLLANIGALLIMFFLRNQGFFIATAAFFYFSVIVVVISLLFAYFRVASNTKITL